MPFLLDTVTCSAHFNSRQRGLIHTRLIQHGGQLHVSRLSCAELFAWGYSRNAKMLADIDDFLNEVAVLEFDDECARTYGQIHARLAAFGQSATGVDLMIAATALIHGIVLVTHDRGFNAIQKIVPELQLLDWLS